MTDKNTTFYKVVDTNSGLSIAHIDARIANHVITPETDDSRVRVDTCMTTYIENNESLGWGPIDQRTTYQIGETTNAEDICTDETNVSGAGLHLFTNRTDAIAWMNTVDA